MTRFSSFAYWNSQQFKAALRVLFYPERPQNRVLLKYMDIGAFVLTIDDGREHLQLTDQEGWTSTIQCGMTIVMSIVMTQQSYFWEETYHYKCPFCECWNSLQGNKSWIDWWVSQGSVQLRGFYSLAWTLSQSCQRRVQVKRVDADIHETEIATIANNERDLILNLYLRQEVSDITGLLRCSSWPDCDHFKSSAGAYRQFMNCSFSTDHFDPLNSQKVCDAIPATAHSLLTLLLLSTTGTLNSQRVRNAIPSTAHSILSSFSLIKVFFRTWKAPPGDSYSKIWWLLWSSKISRSEL
jgi:hypothetical protein